MKALFTCIFLTFFGAFAAFSQNQPKAENSNIFPISSAGIKAGVNMATVSNLAESGMYLGFHGGVFGNLQFGEVVGLGSEITYSNQGVTISNLDCAFNYINIPLILNLHADPVVFQFGAYGSFLLNARARNGQEKEDITKYVHPFDSGILLGLNFQTSGPTFFGLRVNLGLQNINDRFAKPFEAKLYNQTGQLSVGYKF